MSVVNNTQPTTDNGPILTMKKIMTVCCAGGLIVILSLCTVSTVESAVAFITAYPAGKQLDNWRENQRQLEHAQWEKIQSQIDLALQFTPDNPELLNDLGLSHEAEFIFSEDTDPSATRDRKTAARYYQQAVVLRPSWPYDRIDLALVDYRLYGTNRNLYKLMRQAVELGPWEPRVQQVVTEIGLRNWKGLPDNMKKVVKETVNNGVRHPDNTKDILALLRRYNMSELVCAEKNDNEEVVKFCEKN